MVAPATTQALLALPRQLYDKLFDFQKEGVLFALQNDGRCLIGDEMGLGKTLQALSVAYCYKDEWPLLIIVPSSLRYPWIEELEKWFPSLQPGDIHLVNSGTDVRAISMCKVCLISYGLMRNDSKTLLEALYQQQFQVIVIDESHYLKNLKAARTKVLVPLLKKAKRLLLLTGTPALARPAELFPQLDCLRPGLFGTWSTFTKRFCNAGWRYFGRNRMWDTSGASNLQELHSKLKSSVLIRREKKDVLRQLPPKQRQKVPFDLAESDQKQDLEKHWRDLHSLINGDITDDHTQSNAALEIRKLISQLYIQTGQTKIGAVCDYISMLLDNPGLKFLVFAHHRDVLTAICQTIMKYNKEKKQDVQYIRIDGDVPSSERMHLVNKFQKEEHTRVAVLSIQAAGVGLTFTAATDVVFAELHWTPGVMEQCEDRAHRIGQVNSIHIHYLIAKGSIDEWMWAALSRKVNVVSSTLNGKLQHLQASVCNKEDIDFLNFATVWIPSKDSELDDGDDCYFSKEENKLQPDIRTFFTPKERKKTANFVPGQISDKIKDSVSLKSINKSVTDKRKAFDDNLSYLEDNITNHEIFLSKTNDTSSVLKHDFCKNTDDLPVKGSVKRRSYFSESENNFNASSSPSKDEPLSKRRCTSNITVDKTIEDVSFHSGPGDKCETSCEVFMSSINKCQISANECSTDKSQTTSDKIQDSNEKCQVSSGDKYWAPNDKCQISSANKSQASASAADQMSWNCSLCTYSNHQMLTYCEMCSTPKSVVKTAQKKKALNIDKHKSSGRSRKRISLNRVDFVDADLDNFDVSPRSKMLCQTANKVKDMVISSNSNMNKPVQTLHTYEIKKFDEDGKEASSKIESDNVCINCCNTCQNCTCKDVVMTPNQLNEADASLLEDLVAAESWISSQNTKKASQESWACGECGYVSQGDDECDSCWSPKPSNSAIDFKSLKISTKVNSTKTCKSIISSSKRSKFSNVSSSINSFQQDSDSSVSSQLDQEMSCDINNSDILLKVKDELDESSTINRVFKYRASLHTNRIYLYNEEGTFLEESFFPVDVQLKNFDSLPKILQHPFTLGLVQRFVRQWNRLTLPQQKQVCKTGQQFVNPQQILDDIKMQRKQNPSTKRFVTKDDLANSALNKASEVGGTLRIISKLPMSAKGTKSTTSPKIFNKFPGQSQQKTVDSTTSNTSSDSTTSQRIESSRNKWMKSPPRTSRSLPLGDSPGKRKYLQVMDSEGCPLCIFCNQPCQLATTSKSYHPSEVWDTRYCSERCKDDHMMQGKNSSYIRQQLFQLEHGICQLCGLDTHHLFVQIRNLPKDQRKELLADSKYSSLSVTELNKIIKAPSEGQFWHADHIVAVADGGGLCQIDNFRTLCVMCHMIVTANQHRSRSIAKRSSGIRDIKSFFKPN